MVTVTSRDGSYFIAFSETQTPEEWKLIQQAKALEQRQMRNEEEPELIGGVDWEKFRRAGKQDSYINLNEWTEIVLDD